MAYKEISLTQGKVTIVDETDYDWLMQWKWHLDKRNGYARRSIYKGYINGKKKVDVLTIHRLITNAPHGFEVDHINGNTLDNRRSNLRICTKSQNMCNQKIRSTFGKSSKYKGVYFRKDRCLWMSYIRINGKRIHLGFFNSEMLAAIAYNEAAKKYHGEWAKLNSID